MIISISCRLINLLFCCFLCCLQQNHCFNLSPFIVKTNNNICFSKTKQYKQWSDRTQYVHTQRLFSKIVDNKDDPKNKDGQRNDIVLLSFDGTIAETSTWRSNMAIDVAYSIWPNGMNTNGMQSYQLDDPKTDRSWIINKMKALMQNLLSDQNGMTNCDAVLLVRLLMEEQLLDQGRSVGKKGKYASKFHPKSISDMDDFPSKSMGSNQGSRPLTVGEIAANWVNGACLRDTVRVKYNVNRKDPIPIINERIIELMKKQECTYTLPIVHEVIFKWIEQCQKTLFVMVGHESHLRVAKKSLEQTSISTEIISVDEVENILGQLKNSPNENERKIFLIAPGDGDRGHVGILQQIIMSAKSNRVTYIQFIHPIVETLKKSRVLYGDNRPMLNNNNYGKSGVRGDVSLNLSLPTWTDIVGEKEQDEIIMFAPWLSIIDESCLFKTNDNQIIQS